MVVTAAMPTAFSARILQHQIGAPNPCSSPACPRPTLPTPSLGLFIRDDDGSIRRALGGKPVAEIQGAPHLFAPHDSGHTPSDGKFPHPETPERRYRITAHAIVRAPKPQR